MTVGVTGASGHLGRQTAELLLERLDPAQVVLVTRNPDRLAQLADRGAAVRRGDFADPASLEGAFAGVERLLLISTDDVGSRTAQQRDAIAAARTAGVRHVAYTSVPKPEPENPGFVAPSHRATEDALRDSGLAWTMLRNSLYSEYQVPGAAAAAVSGKLVTSAGSGRIAYVSREDCAAAAAAVLTGDGHAGQVYDITGPELLTPDDVAALIADVVGRPIEVVHVDDDALVAGIVQSGLPEPVARGIASLAAAIRGGWMDSCTSAVQDLTGRPPRSLRAVFEAHRATITGTP